MESKRLLVIMAERLYEDIRFITEQNSTQIVDDDGARAYNLLLSKSRKYHPNLEFLPDFSEWTPRTIKYKDALVVVGQLAAVLKAVLDSPMEDSLRHGSSPKVEKPAAMNNSASSSISQIGSAGSAESSRRSASSDSSFSSSRGSSSGIGTMQPQVTQATQVSQIPAPPKPIVPRKPMAPPPPPPPTSSPGSRGGVEEDHDRELYGTQPLSKRREDGTIPFTME